MAVHSRAHPLGRLRALDLITRGRKTGRGRRVELWFVFPDGAVHPLSGAGRAEVLPPDAVEVITGRGVSGAGTGDGPAPGSDSPSLTEGGD